MERFNTQLKLKLDELLNIIEQTQNIGFETDKKKEQYNSKIQVNEERLENNKENNYLKKVMR